MEGNWRVKLYALGTDGQWEDRGIGTLSVGEDRLQISGEGSTVHSLIDHPIGHEPYRRQGDSIITWTSPTYSTYAISFQDSGTATVFWQQLCELQGKCPVEALDEMKKLPIPTPENIHGVIEILGDSVLNRSNLIGFIENSNFLCELKTEFLGAEQRDLQEVLSLYCFAYKFLVQLMSEGIMEELLSDEQYRTFFGALEYDSDLKGMQFKYRALLDSQGTFRNVLELLEVQKMTLAFRLQFLKESASFKLLNEPAAAFLSNMLITVWNELVGTFLEERELQVKLLGKLRAHEYSAFLFLGELVGLVKSVSFVNRCRFYDFVCDDRVFELLDEHWAFLGWSESQCLELRLLVSELFLSMYQVSPQRLKLYFLDCLHDIEPLILKFALQLLTSDRPYVVQATAEFVKTLLEDDESRCFEDLNEFLYDSVLLKCVEKITVRVGSEEGLLYSVEVLGILTHCVSRHTVRARDFLLLNDIFARVLCLFDSESQVLKLSAVKFMKAVVESRDQQLLKTVVNRSYLSKVFDVWKECGDKENLIFSCVYSMVKSIENHDYSKLVVHVVEEQIPRLTPKLKDLCSGVLKKNSARAQLAPPSLRTVHSIDLATEEDIESAYHPPCKKLKRDGI